MTDNQNTPLEESLDIMPEETQTTAEATNPSAVDELDTETEVTAAQENAESISDELAQAKADSERHYAGWQRALADFQNYKRRMERETAEMRTRITLETISQMLPIIDDFERALGNIPENLADDPWISGVSLIQDKFRKLLDEHDIEVLDPVGEPFDPNHHQAISKDDSDEIESDHVIETLQKGYISGKHLLRPAIVRVAI